MANLNEAFAKERITEQLDKPVRKCMKRSGLVTLSIENGFEALVSVLSKHHFKKIPVLDQNNRMVGVISRGDVMRVIVQKWINETAKIKIEINLFPSIYPLPLV